MPAFRATAPGKIILFGEHAVVYGQPALAVPVPAVRAQAIVSAAPDLPAGELRLTAPAVDLHDTPWLHLAPVHPLRRAVDLTLETLGIPRPLAARMRVTSTIPVAAGLGSGAAVTVAMVRALSGFLGAPLPPEQVNAIAYEVEKIHHGTPSGIDNTVVTYAKPVYFVRGEPVQTFQVGRPFTLVIADTGVPAPTAQAVADVRQAAEAQPEVYRALFTQIGKIARQARTAIEAGEPARLGALMDVNHALLQDMGVSCPALDRLVAAAKESGAAGAKLSGGGRGGNMIALVPPEAGPEAAEAIAEALRAAGAVRTIVTTIGA
ncbi:MAG: mevalonate kinase [Chloroflexi bacterium]|nr:mevalonate kinase [Chloroflexota bacterium]